MKSITFKNSYLIGMRTSLKNRQNSQKLASQINSKSLNSSQNILSLMHKQSQVGSAIAFKGRPLPTGFNSIDGYDDIKQDFKEYFIGKLAAEKEGQDVKMPNGILFLGTTDDNRKNDLAKALAEESDCNIVKVDYNGDDSQYIKNIHDEANFAKISYEKGYPRTVILLNDFDRILGAKRYLKSRLQSLLNNCADRNKTTLFMTTNLSIDGFANDESLIQDYRIPKHYSVASN